MHFFSGSKPQGTNGKEKKSTEISAWREGFTIYSSSRGWVPFETISHAHTLRTAVSPWRLREDEKLHSTGDTAVHCCTAVELRALDALALLTAPAAMIGVCTAELLLLSQRRYRSAVLLRMILQM